MAAGRLGLGALAGAAAAAFIGCGGGAASGLGFARAEVPFDRPLGSPPTDAATMHWKRGEVAEVSLDGAVVQITVKGGVIPRGARVGIYVDTPEKPGPHYMWDEARELRVAEATVVRTLGDRCEAQIVERSTNAPVSVGDKVIELVP